MQTIANKFQWIFLPHTKLLNFLTIWNELEEVVFLTATAAVVVDLQKGEITQEIEGERWPVVVARRDFFVRVNEIDFGWFSFVRVICCFFLCFEYTKNLKFMLFESWKHRCALYRCLIEDRRNKKSGMNDERFRLCNANKRKKYF